jgi:hypothetical protein
LIHYPIQVDFDKDRKMLFDIYEKREKSFRGVREDIPKRTSDLIRFNSRFRINSKGWGRGDVNYYNFINTGTSTTSVENCASYSSSLWNAIMIDLGRNNKKVPYSAIPGVINLSFL